MISPLPRPFALQIPQASQTCSISLLTIHSFTSPLCDLPSDLSPVLLTFDLSPIFSTWHPTLGQVLDLIGAQDKTLYSLKTSSPLSIPSPKRYHKARGYLRQSPYQTALIPFLNISVFSSQRNGRLVLLCRAPDTPQITTDSISSLDSPPSNSPNMTTVYLPSPLKIHPCGSLLKGS